MDIFEFRSKTLNKNRPRFHSYPHDGSGGDAVSQSPVKAVTISVPSVTYTSGHRAHSTVSKSAGALPSKGRAPASDTKGSRKTAQNASETRALLITDRTTSPLPSSTSTSPKKHRKAVSARGTRMSASSRKDGPPAASPSESDAVGYASGSARGISREPSGKKRKKKAKRKGSEPGRGGASRSVSPSSLSMRFDDERRLITDQLRQDLLAEVRAGLRSDVSSSETKIKPKLRGVSVKN